VLCFVTDGWVILGCIRIAKVRTGWLGYVKSRVKVRNAFVLILFTL
jgi:hypothetical protein